MRYVSIDIETTGLDPEKHQILEIAAVIEDTSIPMEERHTVLDLPYKLMYVDHDELTFHPDALTMHQDLLRAWNKQKEGRTNEEDVMTYLRHWLSEHEFVLERLSSGDTFITINVAGKNFAGFDWQFMKVLPQSHYIKPRFRTLDPAILYFDPSDTHLPSLSQCVSRMNSKLDESLEITHRAYEDALMVIRLLRHMGI